MKKLFILIGLIYSTAYAQPTFPVNGIHHQAIPQAIYENATIVVGNGEIIDKGYIYIDKGLIKSIGKTPQKMDESIPRINCSGKYIYPSFIDLFSNYGLATAIEQRDKIQNKAWNPAMHAEANAANYFKYDDKAAIALRKNGFGVVLTHIQDGIARGSAALVNLAQQHENKLMIKPIAAQVFSLNKGNSTYDYPNSLMGAIALLRQNYYDALWYSTHPQEEGFNAGLHSYWTNRSLPQIFDAGDKWNDLRAAKIGVETGASFIIKGGTNEYQRIDEIKNTRSSFILPLNFPAAFDIADPLDARFIPLSELKHWDWAPTNLKAMQDAQIKFAITSSDLKDATTFMSQLQKAIQYGLSDSLALAALTIIPAQMINMQSQIGTLEKNKQANFLITDGKIFQPKTKILKNIIAGIPYEINAWPIPNSEYSFRVGNKEYRIIDKNIYTSSDTATVSFTFNGLLVNGTIQFKKDSTQNIRFSGVQTEENIYEGKINNGIQAFILKRTVQENAKDTSSAVQVPKKPHTPLYKPHQGYGISGQRIQENLIIQDATIWTNESQGVLKEADIYIQNGKIMAIGKDLPTKGARIINGRGMHVTPGIIDEHSHIAVTGGVNECSQSITSEVRIADVINPDDINIYRQLSGGVTTSHILHGSCNTIGGQTQLLKLRWGANAEELKYKKWIPQIKFALGENVKRSSYSSSNRYPDSRMGVAQVLYDGFSRAKKYQKTADRRRDLELDALSDILSGKMHITCHSYVQSEINAIMHIADSLGFKVNTLTHILEGYKVADKMKKHGANASTFSDWWAYKMEVIDAIPQNAAIMQRVGLNVAVNSDDAEMARRLNQEAAKSIKYADMDPQEALKMVTLNPAKMLHIDDQVGSLKVGKDADIVVWTADPLSIYARVQYTIVDGIIYFDKERDEQLQASIQKERELLIEKMILAKKSGEASQPIKAEPMYEDHCEDDHPKSAIEY